MIARTGYLMLAFHAHLPWVRHPEHPEFLEEDWLFEAVTETYVPILAMAERLDAEGIPYRFTMTLSPTLCEMLADPLLQERYVRRLEKMRELCERERSRVEGTAFAAAAEAHRRMFAQAWEVFEKRCARKLLPAFRALQDRGGVEIITCAATHAFLPFVSRPEAVRAQIAVAVENYRKHFGRPPRGIWLPECGYAPGLEGALEEHDLRFFFLEAHGLLNGSRPPRAGVFAPVRTPAGLFAFGRDLESSRQVWSAREGYPGDPAYREFYRDVGYDAEEPYIRPYLHPDGVRRNLGLKYHRVTGGVSLDRKEPYDPDAALRRADEHAGHFMFNRQHQARWLRDRLGAPPVIACPYDAELFGHWWFEGPRFLETLLRRIARDQGEIAATTPSEWLADFPGGQEVEPSMSTWGDKGYAEMWLNGSNDWIYRHQHRAEVRMADLAQRHRGAEGLLKRALTQAARELLLLQASDWAFLMSAGTAVPYGHRRFKEHVSRFLRLADGIEAGRIDGAELSDLESRDCIFPELDYRVFA